MACTGPTVLMPSTWWRVVWGLREVMLSFCPRIWFSSVDLPTLGRPTIATKPQRLSGFSGRVISFIRVSPRQVASARYGPLPAPPHGDCCPLHWFSDPAMATHRTHEMSVYELPHLPK